MNCFDSTDRSLAPTTFVKLPGLVLETITSAPGTRDAVAEAHFTGIRTCAAGLSNSTWILEIAFMEPDYNRDEFPAIGTNATRA